MPEGHKLCPDCEKEIPGDAEVCPHCNLDLNAFSSFDRIASTREKKQARERKEREEKERKDKEEAAKKKKGPGMLESWGLKKSKEA